MYIDKWWGNITCGDTDDSLLLVDYFASTDKEEYILSEIIKDLHLDDILGKKPIYESGEKNGFFWLDKEQKKFFADFNIIINVIIDLSALVLQSLVEGSIELVDNDDEKMNFSILAEKNEIKVLVSELENAIKNPNLYYESFEDDFAEMTDGIKEIANELKQYY
jgi:hypothetical protein